ncbi:MAG: hypothetical protein AABZ73_09450 [Pseudomonadota bacterium]|uniref:hypothetical protein n=1 Tax=Sphingobium sp. TaxID=1912891 RepID=UPI002E1BDEF2
MMPMIVLQNPHRTLWAALALLLALPAVAMAFTSEVRWGLGDFAAAGLLLGGVGLGVELATRVMASAPARALACSAVVAAALLIWAEAAVGIF